jgi:DNA-binding NarL/FixJ family response regulator
MVDIVNTRNRDDFVLTLLLIEPAPVLRQSLRNWLELNFAPCAIREAENLSAALERSPEENLHAILLDLDMLSEAEWGNIPQLTRIFPQAAILGMGLDDTPSHRQRAESAGVAAFVAKSQLQSELLRTLKEVNPSNRDARNKNQYKEKQ